MAKLRNTVVVMLTCLSACAPHVNGTAEKARIESECSSQGFKTRYDQVKCENNARLVSKSKHGLDTSTDYQQYLHERLRIAAEVDEKRISPREAELRDEQAYLDYQKKLDAYNSSIAARKQTRPNVNDREMWKRLYEDEGENVRCRHYCPTSDNCYTDCRTQ